MVVCEHRRGNPRHPPPTTTVTHTLCLDNCQTFEFCPAGDHVTMIRRAPRPTLTRKGWRPVGQIVTGRFEMTREEARKQWASLVKDGAFKV